MRALTQLFRATLLEFVREPAGVSIAVMLPLMFVLFFGFAYADQRMGSGLRQIDFVVPGVLGLGLMWQGIFAAIPLAAQRELGVLRRLGVTPAPHHTVVIAQIAARLVVALAQAALIFGAAALLFGVQFQALAAVVAVVMLGALVFVTLGYAIAALAPTQPAAHGVAQVVSMPMVFLAGAFFPVNAMPGFLQPLVLLMPLTYLADALRQVALGAAIGAFPLPLDLGVMAGFTVVLGGVAVRWFRWL